MPLVPHTYSLLTEQLGSCEPLATTETGEILPSAVPGSYVSVSDDGEVRVIPKHPAYVVGEYVVKPMLDGVRTLFSSTASFFKRVDSALTFPGAAASLTPTCDLREISAQCKEWPVIPFTSTECKSMKGGDLQAVAKEFSALVLDNDVTLAKAKHLAEQAYKAFGILRYKECGAENRQAAKSIFVDIVNKVAEMDEESFVHAFLLALDEADEANVLRYTYEDTILDRGEGLFWEMSQALLHLGNTWFEKAIVNVSDAIIDAVAGDDVHMMTYLRDVKPLPSCGSVIKIKTKSSRVVLHDIRSQDLPRFREQNIIGRGDRFIKVSDLGNSTTHSFTADEVKSLQVLFYAYDISTVRWQNYKLRLSGTADLSWYTRLDDTGFDRCAPTLKDGGGASIWLSDLKPFLDELRSEFKAEVAAQDAARELQKRTDVKRAMG